MSLLKKRHRHCSSAAWNDSSPQGRVNWHEATQNMSCVETEQNMKKKLNKKVIGYVAFIVAGVAITACGTAHTKYNTAGVTASQTAATTTIPTAIQGLWTSCSNGALTSMSFFDNGYWMETDQNSASDCSGTTTSSGTEEIRNFRNGSRDGRKHRIRSNDHFHAIGNR